MVDNNQINPDAEYRPKEEGYTDIPQTLGIPQPQVTGKLKRIFIVLAIIVVIFFAYNFFNWYSGQKPEAQDKKPSTVKQSQLVALPTTPIVIGDKSNLITSEVNDSSVRKQLDILSQEVESNREQLAELNNSLSQGQQAMENLNKNISSLSASLKDIGEKVQQIASKETKPVAKKELKSNVIKKKIPIYHVKAIVPERVWLESDTGETVSVRVGDTLDGYGSVQAISPKQGIVVTSSKIIKYGNNDF